MHKIKLLISPDRGVEPAILETDPKSKGSIEGLAFYAKVEAEIEKFRKSIRKAISAGREPNENAPLHGTR